MDANTIPWETPAQSQIYTTAPHQGPSPIEVWGDKGPMVTVHPDGKVTFAAGVTPDAAAKAFWDAVQKMGVCPAIAAPPIVPGGAK